MFYISAWAQSFVLPVCSLNNVMLILEANRLAKCTLMAFVAAPFPEAVTQ